MKSLRNVFAIVLCFALVLGAAPMVAFAADDYDSVPAIVQSEGMYTVYEGVRGSGTLGSSASSDQSIGDYMIGDRAKCDLGSKIDFTDYGYIEFDIYVDNLANLKSKVSQLSVYFQNTDGAKRVYWYYQDYLTDNGWNHIKLDLDEYDFIKGSNPRNLVSSVRFRMLITAATSDYSTDRIRLANIAITNKAYSSTYSEIPEMIQSLGMFTVCEGEVGSGAWGNTASSDQTLGDYISIYKMGAKASFSEYNHIEFDFYVDNLEHLKSKVNRLSVAMQNSDDQKRIYWYFDDELTNDGWNHVKIDLSDYDDILNSNPIASVTYFRFRKLVTIATNDYSTERFRIANLAVTKTAESYYSLPYNPIVTVGKDQTEVNITWFTNGDLPGKLVFNGTEISPFESGLSDDAIRYYHRAKVTGLTANTIYNYSVGNEEYIYGPFTLKTKDFDDDFSFVQITDIQLPTNNKYLDNWKNTLSQISTNLPDTSFILNTGDISDSYKTENYGYYKSPEQLPSYVTTAIPGNHDNTPNSYFDEHFTSPETYEEYPGYGLNECDYWYSYNSILFIALNTNIKDSGYHINFLRKVVDEQGDNYRWIIVNCHHSLFSASYHKDERDVYTFRENLAPVYSELGIDLVLSGHDHCYDRSYMMRGAYPQVSTESFSANSNGGVLYVSAQSGSALKFNTPKAGCDEYSAKIVESKYGFVNYDVTNSEITLTYYSSADMSVLDTFTLYKDDGRHTVEPDTNLLANKNLENVQLNSNGKYSVQFDEAQDISSACAVEIDLGLKDDDTLSNITLALVDENGNSVTKSFAGITTGWNHLATNIADMVGSAELTNIVAVELTGAAGTDFAVANLFAGHTYTDDEDTTCEGCDNVRELFVDPMTVPESNFKYEVLDSVEGSLHTIKGITPGTNIYQNYAHYFMLPKTLNTVGGQYVEFDLYVSADTDNSFYFWVSNSRESGYPRGRYTIPAGLTSGWNHIVIYALSGYIVSGSGYNFDGYPLSYPFFEGTPYSSNHPTGGDFKVANIAVTYDKSTLVPAMNNVYTTVDSIEGNIHAIKNITPGTNIYQNYTHYFMLSKTLNTVGGQYIEFDLCVSKDTDNSFYFWVSNKRESGYPRGRYTIPAGLKAGWNHIVIDALSGYIASGSGYNFDGYELSYPFFEGTPYSSNHPTGGDIVIANLAVTKHTCIEGAPVDNGDGTHSIFCIVDGELLSTVEHEFIDGTCLCGALEPADTIGDFNDDGIIDIRDLVCLKKILAGIDVTTDSKSDVNSDGKTDATDLVVFVKYLLGIISDFKFI